MSLNLARDGLIEGRTAARLSLETPDRTVLGLMGLDDFKRHIMPFVYIFVFGTKLALLLRNKVESSYSVEFIGRDLLCFNVV